MNTIKNLSFWVGLFPLALAVASIWMFITYSAERHPYHLIFISVACLILTIMLWSADSWLKSSVFNDMKRDYTAFKNRIKA